MVLATDGSSSWHAFSKNLLVICFIALICWCAAISTSWAVTVRTCGPFDVSFYGSGDSYTDFGTTYTGSKNWTTTEMDDVAAMIQAWDNGIANAAGPRQIKLNLMWNSIGGSLGISSTGYTGDGITAQTYAEQLWRKGTFVANDNADSFIRFDSSTTWNTGAGAPTFNAWDFRSVVAHEIGHALGFISSYDSSTDAWWIGGLTEWDKHLRDASTGGNTPVANGSGTPGNFNQAGNSVYFDGVNADAANGGNRVKIFSPLPYQAGSSLTHIDETTFPNALMSTSIANGQVDRQPSVLEWNIMKDLGWTITTVTKTWTNWGNNLQWGTDANWDANGMPNAAHSVYFTNLGIVANDIITLGGDRSVNSLFFDTTTSFTIDGASGTLTISTGFLSRANTSSGTQTISRPIALGANGLWDINGSGSLSVTGAISGAYSLDKGGTGTLYLSGANTYNGTTNVKIGTLIISGGSTASAGFNTVSGTTLSFSGGTHNLTSIAFNNAGTLNFIGGTENLSAANFTNSGTININGSTVTFDSATSMPGAVNFNSGTLNGAGMVTFTSPLTWTGGTMSGSGTTKIQGGLIFNGSGTSILDGRTLLNTGTATFSGFNYLNGRNGAALNNQSGALIDLQGTNIFSYGSIGAVPSINNAGIFRKSTSTSAIDIAFAMNNSGSVDVQRGTLNLWSGGTSSGSFNVASGAILAFAGGTHNLGGATFTNSGAINLSGATVSFNSPTSLPGAVNLSAGALTGTSTATFAGLLTWTNGTMSGSGITQAQGGINFSGNGDPLLDGRTLNNAGSAVFSASNYLYGRNGAVFNNQLGAVLDLQGSNRLFYDGIGAVPAINNAGTFRKSLSFSTIDVGFALNNSGAVQVQTGTLNLSAGGTSSGSFNISSGAVLGFISGTQSLGGATFSNLGAINLSGAAVSFNSPTNLPGNVNFSGGTLTGTATTTFTGLLTWTNGAMSGSGTTQAQGGIVLSGLGDPLLDGRTLANAGTAAFSSSNWLHGKNGATVNNLSGALIDLQGFNDFVNDAVGAIPSVNNAGTFRKSISPGTVNIDFAMNNTGTVQVQTGSLNLVGPVTQISGNTLTGGSWIVKANSFLDFLPENNITVNKGNITLDGIGSSFSNINNLNDNQGTLSILGGRNFSTVANLANSGTLTVGAGSSLTVTGGLTGSGDTYVNGLLTADSISQDILNIGSGATVTIRPLAGGTLGYENIRAVPEPGTIAMLLMMMAAAGVMRKLTR